MYDIWYTQRDMWYKIYNTGNVLQQLLQLKFDLAKLANLTNITLQNQQERVALQERKETSNSRL